MGRVGRVGDIFREEAPVVDVQAAWLARIRHAAAHVGAGRAGHLLIVGLAADHQVVDFVAEVPDPHDRPGLMSKWKRKLRIVLYSKIHQSNYY